MFLVNCGDPGAPVNGNRSFTDTLEGSIVTYTCNAGFELVGNRTQTCELTPDGASWSYDRPECTCTVIVISINKDIHSKLLQLFSVETLVHPTMEERQYQLILLAQQQFTFVTKDISLMEQVREYA